METKIIDLLRDARQLILFGPPGTGKTYTAKRAAARLLGNTWPAEEEATTDALDDGRDDQRFILVVFHPSYEYDQFIGGLTVDVSAEQQELQYRLQTGPLLAMCEHAAAHPDDTHVLLIDEINRGNLSKLLGELLHALEYRDEKVTLPFRSDPLVVPKNLYIIATMNSSDRSIGHIDVATRRRFALFHVPPDSAVVRSKWENQWGDAESGERLAGAMEAINQKLREEGKDEDLGVGQSYFLPYRGCDEKSAVVSVLRKINHSLLPLLREYDEMIGHTGDSCLAPEEEFENLDAVFECKRWLA
jgi:5-methylcytosine-specific restriction protein B